MDMMLIPGLRLITGIELLQAIETQAQKSDMPLPSLKIECLGGACPKVHC
jgi:hypothetical protein